MFKLMFRIMVIVLFTVFLTVSLALWKGGEPFRVIGEGTEIIGRAISEFGNFVDDFISGGKQIGKRYEKIKEIVVPDKK
jgi:hypothetical protein